MKIALPVYLKFCAFTFIAIYQIQKISAENGNKLLLTGDQLHQEKLKLEEKNVTKNNENSKDSSSKQQQEHSNIQEVSAQVQDKLKHNSTPAYGETDTQSDKPLIYTDINNSKNDDLIIKDNDYSLKKSIKNFINKRSALLYSISTKLVLLLLVGLAAFLIRLYWIRGCNSLCNLSENAEVGDEAYDFSAKSRGFELSENKFFNSNLETQNLQNSDAGGSFGSGKNNSTISLNAAVACADSVMTVKNDNSEMTIENVNEMIENEYSSIVYANIEQSELVYSNRNMKQSVISVENDKGIDYLTEVNAEVLCVSGGIEGDITEEDSDRLSVSGGIEGDVTEDIDKLSVSGDIEGSVTNENTDKLSVSGDGDDSLIRSTTSSESFEVVNNTNSLEAADWSIYDESEKDTFLFKDTSQNVDTEIKSTNNTQDATATGNSREIGELKYAEDNEKENLKKKNAHTESNSRSKNDTLKRKLDTFAESLAKIDANINNSENGVEKNGVSNVSFDETLNAANSVKSPKLDATDKNNEKEKLDVETARKDAVGEVKLTNL